MMREGHRRLPGRHIPGTLCLTNTFPVPDEVWRRLQVEAEPGFTRLEREI